MKMTETCGNKKDSLFEYISSAVVNGELPEDFSLPSMTDDENEVKWADGAMDGVTMYHMSIPEIGKDDRTSDFP